MQVVGERYLLLQQATNADDIVQEIIASKADLILSSINGGTNLTFFHELRTAGVRPERVPTISFSIGEVELRDFVVGEMAGDYASWDYFMSLDTPENQAFIAAFRARYGKQRVTSDPMATAYVAVKIWANAVREAGGKTDSASVRAALKKTRFEGPTGLVKFDPANLNAWSSSRIGQIHEDGQFKVVHAGPLVEPQPFPPTRTKQQWLDFLDRLHNQWGQRWENPGPKPTQP